jgi:Na+/melibiose symporter-like transporter
MLMLALQFLGQAGSNLVLVVSLIVVSLLLYIAFIFAEKFAKDPLVPLALFRNRSLMAKNGMMFLQYGFFGFYSNYLPTWSQGVFGTTALVGGMILIPSALALAISSRLSNRILSKLTERTSLILGMLLMLAGDLLLAVLPFHASMIWLFVASGMIGFSFGLVNVTLQVAVQETVEPRFIGAATALNALIRTLGTTLVLSTLSVSLNQTFNSATQHNRSLSMTLINMISDSKALHLIPSALITPLRNVLYSGLHNLTLISLIVIGLALVLNFIDPWDKAGQN